MHADIKHINSVYVGIHCDLILNYGDQANLFFIYYLYGMEGGRVQEYNMCSYKTAYIEFVA